MILLTYLQDVSGLRWRLIDMYWSEHSGIDEAIDQWHTRHHSCIQDTGGHYAYSL